MKYQKRVLLKSVLALSLLAGLAGPAAAQDELARTGPGTIEVPCCKCIDGNETVIDLNTGTAPWISTTGAASMPTPNPNWASSPPAKWIFDGGTTRGRHTYQLKIRIPNCIIPMHVRIEGKAWGDDVLQMQIDGRSIGRSGLPAAAIHSTNSTWPPFNLLAGSYAGFGQNAQLNINESLSVNGTHVITANVENAGGPAGFLFNGKLVVKCSSGPLTRGGRRD